jgi:Flp pilus assembly protein TadG
VQLLREAVRQSIRSIEYGWKYNFVERHGHKLMTVSNRFKLRLVRRGLRHIFVRTRREEGVSTVMYEFAMVLPVLAMVLIGITYGGITFYDYAILANAVADGAATLAQGRGNNGVQTNQAPCTAAELMVQTSSYTLKQSQVSVAVPTFVGQQNSAPKSSCSVTSGTNPSNSGSCTPAAPCQLLVSGEMGTISATYPCNLTIPFSGINLCPLNGAAACGAGVSSCVGAETTIRIE